jgi:iron complex outermembrane receptor protein
MKLKQTQIASAVSAALMAIALPGYAQEAATPADDTVQSISVTGIRASLAKSLAVKRNSTATIEVVTAEDIGKMPDKNLADSLQRLSGVAVRTDYDEAEKVSMRGTNPDMSLILFNGHSVSGGDWYLADQSSSSRSTSLSLMPSSVLNQALVYKTSQANIADGGLAGTINVTTRKPLDQKEKFGGVINLGASYAQLPGKYAPDMDATLNWQNEQGTAGLIIQAFSEKRYVRRDSASRLAYGTSSGWDVINTATMKGITDASLAGTGLKAADLNGVRMPGSLSSEFVEGERDRKGGMFALQFKPSKDLDLTMTGFDSKMNANNYGRLTAGATYSMLLGKGEPFGATSATALNTNSNGAQVFAYIKNPVIVDEISNYGTPLKVLKSAEIVFPAGTTPQYIGNSEGFYRDGASATSGFLDLDAKWRINQDLTIKGLVSTTRGVGTTKLDQGLTYARYGTGVAYTLNGVNEAPDVKYYGAGANAPVLNADGSGYSLISRSVNSYETTDKEKSIAFDAEYNQGWGVLSSLETGVRYADHTRLALRWSPKFKASALGQAPVLGYIPYPSNFGNDLGGNFDNTGFTFTPESLKAYFQNAIKTTTPEFERVVSPEIDMRERQSAFYLMQNLEGSDWSGNIGLRFVRTQNDANIVTPIKAGLCQKVEPGKPVVACTAVPDAIVTAGDGTTFYDGTVFNPLLGAIYHKTATSRTFNDLLPSLNLRYEVQKDLIARFGASKTIGRQNYNILGASFTSPVCDASGCTVTGPNPNLHPLTAKNMDLSLAWYFAPRAIATINLFSSDIDGYVKTGANRQGDTVDLVDPADNTVKTFFVNSSTQQGAKIKGWELGYEQPIGLGFGFTSNLSRAMTRVDDGRPMTGASEWASNLGGYFENDTFSARLVWNYRGKYVSSSTAPSPTANSQGNSVINGVVMPVALTWAAPVTNVAFSFNYNVTKQLLVSFDATNLTNPTRAQYRYSEAEQQKLDVSGRQFYLSAKYKF